MRNRLIIFTKLTLGFSFLATTNLSATVNNFDDITNWVGSGVNESALVIDFNNDSAVDSFAWGYRWSEPVSPVVISGADMIVAIAAADPDLSIVYGGTPEDGFFLIEVTYRTFSEASGDFVTNFDYWNYHIAGGTADGNTIAGGGSALPSWTESPTGAGDQGFGSVGRLLADGSWDAYSIGPFVTAPSGPIAAAPEPGQFGLILSAFSAMFLLGRRRGRTLTGLSR